VFNVRVEYLEEGRGPHPLLLEVFRHFEQCNDLDDNAGPAGSSHALVKLRCSCQGISEEGGNE